MKHEIQVEHLERVMEGDMFYMGTQVFSRTVRESVAPDMGMGPGSLIRQEIEKDEYGIDARDLDNGYRCFISLANSTQCQVITGHQSP